MIEEDEEKEMISKNIMGKKAKIIVGATLGLIVLFVLVPSAYSLQMTGQQFFPDGTGTAYFDDGTTESFNHTITPENGYYYDNTTVFVYGQIPGYESNMTIWNLNAQSFEEGEGLGVTGDFINVTIANGAEILGDRAIQPSNIIKAKVGDVLVFTNEDWQSHNIMSPPQDYQSQTPAGGNFDFVLQPGQNTTLVLTKPTGMHFNDLFVSNIKGAIIVEER